jgi:hypothetical protein
MIELVSGMPAPKFRGRIFVSARFKATGVVDVTRLHKPASLILTMNRPTYVLVSLVVLSLWLSHE